MNFQELALKLKAIEEGAAQPVAECGDMPGDLAHPPKQQDNVTMNVSMNGSGAGGIKDLMNILHNIETGHADHGDDHGADALFGTEREVDETGQDGGFEDATTNPNEVTLDIDSVIPTGNDMNSKGGNEVEKVNGGGNPYSNVDESLVAKLHAMYEEIKAS